jgi:hypothetical protein
MFTYTFEYRIRKQGDSRPWLDIPATETGKEIDRDAAQANANVLADFTPDCLEVRHNPKNSMQGTYTRPGKAPGESRYPGL